MALQHGKTFGFGLTGFRKFPALRPIVLIIGVAAAGCCSFIVYASATKKDVVIQRSNPLPPWERTDLENPKPSKIITINQQYKVDSQLIELKKEIH